MDDLSYIYLIHSHLREGDTSLLEDILPDSDTYIQAFRFIRKEEDEEEGKEEGDGP